MRFLLSILLVLSLYACKTSPNSPAAWLADTEIALTTALQTADGMLTAACTVPASKTCGDGLAWHAKAIDISKKGKASLITARASLASNPDNANAAIIAANAVIQQINQMIQEGIK
jgi:hypothetical protein